MTITRREIEKLVRQAIDEKRWLIHTSEDGVAYDGEDFAGLRWNDIGEWTEDPAWNPQVYGRGLLGQGPRASGDLPGYFHGRGEFCITDGPQVVDEMAQKSPRAMILLINDLSSVHGLDVGGDLDLGTCVGLTALPIGLTVGELNLSGCTGLTRLPGLLKVFGHLFLTSCTGITSLPDGLTVGGNLSLSRCTGLTRLPERLTVGGDLVLHGCTGLTGLPDDLSAGGDIFADRPDWETHHR